MDSLGPTLIDLAEEPRSELPTGDALERAWAQTADDICRTYKEKLDPKKLAAALPASQRWALDVLRNPGVPDKAEYTWADESLGAEGSER
jgi:hypothetical protein